MMISTRGRYALRIMLDLAQQETDGYTAMKAVAERQGLSQKYLERIVPFLVSEKLVEGVHGKGGGYKLTRSASEYVVGDILRLAEGSLAPVSCLMQDAEECEREEYCLTLPMWKELQKRINDYLDNLTLQDLLDGKVS